MSDEEKRPFKAFDVTCDDGTAGRVSAKSRRKANELADEMCKVHGGLHGEAEPRRE